MRRTPDIFRTDRFATDIILLNMPPFIFESPYISANMSSNLGLAQCGPSAREGSRGGRGPHRGRGQGPSGFESGFRFGKHRVVPHHGWPRHGPPPHVGPRHGAQDISRTDQFNTDIMSMPPSTSEFSNISSNMSCDHGPVRSGPSARGGFRGGKGRHHGRGHGQPGLGPGSAGHDFGQHPMGPHHGWPRHGPPPQDGPRHGSPSPHHRPGPHSGPDHHREERHHGPDSHWGSDHHGRHHHSPGRRAGPGGPHHGRHGGGPWAHRGRHSFAGPSGLHLLRQHQGEGSVRIEVAEAQESYLIFAEVPGLARKHLAAQLDNVSGVLTISGSYPTDPAASSTKSLLQERRHEEFRWEFRLPEDVAVEGILAKLNNGELTVSLPKIAKPELATMPILDNNNIYSQAYGAIAPTKPDAAAPRLSTDEDARPMDDHEEDAWVEVTPKDDQGKAPYG